MSQLTLESVIQRDPSARKHGGNPASTDAHRRVVHSKQDTYRKIMELLKARGTYGATSKEIAGAFGVGLNTISGRFSELKSMQWIRENGLRRDNAAVLVVK